MAFKKKECIKNDNGKLPVNFFKASNFEILYVEYRYVHPVDTHKTIGDFVM